jgi:tetratricopeptide (TPR) repeat protein
MQRLRIPALAACALAAALLTAPGHAPADTVVLNDGRRLEGDVERTDDGYTVTTTDGRTVKVEASQIKSLEVRPDTNPDDAKKRLESLRKSAEKMSDLKLIIARYNEYLKRYAGTDAADDALADLKGWEQRQAKHMTRAGGKWVTPEELGAIQEEAQASAVKARDLIAQGKLREAGPLLDVALQQDPKSAPALFLRGVTQFRQDQLGPARKSFDTVAQLMPDHAPTLNNLAVILWRQEQFALALKYYDAALLAGGSDERIVGNVAEALNALPKEQRDSAATKKVVQHFQEREVTLRQKMEKRGRYPWGSHWVSGEELDKLQDLERENDAKIKDLEAEFDAAEDKVKRIDEDIAETQRGLRRIEATSYSRDATGRTYRLPYPRVYYDMQRDIQNLRRERADQVALMDKMRREARSLKQQLPVPRYSGTQRLIEVEGTPLIPMTDGADTPAG